MEMKKWLMYLEKRIGERDDSNAMQSACGEYNCPCHYDLPKLVTGVTHLTAENERLQQAVNSHGSAYGTDWEDGVEAAAKIADRWDDGYRNSNYASEIAREIRALIPTGTEDV